MNKQDLENLVEAGWSTRRIAEKFECSQMTVRYWLKKFNLKTSPAYFSKVQYRCRFCKETDPSLFYGNKKDTCGKCHNAYMIDRGRLIKQRARTYLGGKCRACDFDKYPTALDIHHLNPEDKDPNFHSMRSWKWERVEQEIKNCILLCKNCHTAVHSGELIINF